MNAQGNEQIVSHWVPLVSPRFHGLKKKKLLFSASEAFQAHFVVHRGRLDTNAKKVFLFLFFFLIIIIIRYPFYLIISAELIKLAS